MQSIVLGKRKKLADDDGEGHRRLRCRSTGAFFSVSYVRPPDETPGPAPKPAKQRISLQWAPPQAAGSVTKPGPAPKPSNATTVVTETKADAGGDQEAPNKPKRRKNKKRGSKASKRKAREEAEERPGEETYCQRAPTSPNALLRMPNGNGPIKRLTDDVVEKMKRLHIPPVPHHGVLTARPKNTGAQKTKWSAAVGRDTHYTIELQPSSTAEESVQKPSRGSLLGEAPEQEAVGAQQERKKEVLVPRHEFDIYAAFERWGLPRHIMQFDRAISTQVSSPNAKTPHLRPPLRGLHPRPGLSPGTFTNVPFLGQDSFDLLATLDTFGAQVEPSRNPARMKQWNEKKGILDSTSPIVAAATAIENDKRERGVAHPESMTQMPISSSIRHNTTNTQLTQPSADRKYQTSLLDRLAFATPPENFFLTPNRAAGYYDFLADASNRGIEAYNHKVPALTEDIPKEPVGRFPELAMSAARELLRAQEEEIEELRQRLAHLATENKFLRGEREVVANRDEQMLSIE